MDATRGLPPSINTGQISQTEAYTPVVAPKSPRTSTINIGLKAIETSSTDASKAPSNVGGKTAQNLSRPIRQMRPGVPTPGGQTTALPSDKSARPMSKATPSPRAGFGAVRSREVPENNNANISQRNTLERMESKILSENPGLSEKFAENPSLPKNLAKLATLSDQVNSSSGSVASLEQKVNEYREVYQQLLSDTHGDATLTNLVHEMSGHRTESTPKEVKQEGSVEQQPQIPSRAAQVGGGRPARRGAVVINQNDAAALHAQIAAKGASAQPKLTTPPTPPRVESAGISMEEIAPTPKSDQASFQEAIAKFHELKEQANTLEGEIASGQKPLEGNASQVMSLKREAANAMVEAGNVLIGSGDQQLKNDGLAVLKNLTPVSSPMPRPSRFGSTKGLVEGLQKQTPDSSIGHVYSHLSAYAAFGSDKNMHAAMHANVQESLTRLDKDIQSLKGKPEFIQLSIQLSALKNDVQVALAADPDASVALAKDMVKNNMTPSNIESGVVSNFTLAFGATYPFLDKDDAEKKDAIRSLTNSYNLLLKNDTTNQAPLQELKQVAAEFSSYMPTLRDTFLPFYATSATLEKVPKGGDDFKAALDAAGGKSAVLQEIAKVNIQLANFKLTANRQTISNDALGYSKGSELSKNYLLANIDKVENGLRALQTAVRAA
ncbi:MAG: hypothetical protein Q8K75_12155 [Chlamydiales bacterium]|nr:hypothetical protein [Chlamydiales bacterium]